MSETIPGYGPLPHPPEMDAALLRSRIAMYLKSGAGDPQGRALLEQACLTLWQTEKNVWVRIARALEISDARISDGK